MDASIKSWSSVGDGNEYVCYSSGGQHSVWTQLSASIPYIYIDSQTCIP